VWVRPQEHEVVGAALAALRQRAGVTQVVLAERLGKPQSFVSSYENGQRRIDLLELLRIVEALGGKPRAVFADVLRRRARSRTQDAVSSKKVIGTAR
jgi:transcriptional regulator with XRE-family HTH domain